MGTNYYATLINHCDCCGRFDEAHICKSLTMFEGFRAGPDAPAPEPFGVIESWHDWKRVLIAGDAQIRDEYDRDHSLDDFIAAVERTDPGRRGSQMRWLLDHNHSLDRDWVDADGFDFHEGEFS